MAQLTKHRDEFILKMSAKELNTLAYIVENSDAADIDDRNLYKELTKYQRWAEAEEKFLQAQEEQLEQVYKHGLTLLPEDMLLEIPMGKVSTEQNRSN